MRPRSVLFTLLAVWLGAEYSFAVRIIQSNDDGWAELYLRSFHDALIDAGHDAVVSAPADDKSGTGESLVVSKICPVSSFTRCSSGSKGRRPGPRREPCQYKSCAANSPPFGSNGTSPRLNWVNSFPVTAMRYGINCFGPGIWDGRPAELAVAGPNLGTNGALSMFQSGTISAAVYAAHVARIPAIAFSGASLGSLPWNTSPSPRRSSVYAQLATILVDAIVASGPPYLPDDIFLNVNFPKVEGACQEVGDFKWVMSRINPGMFSARDTVICGTNRLPTNWQVMRSGGCRISLSVADASDRTTASADKQEVVAKKLWGMWSCVLP